MRTIPSGKIDFIQVVNAACLACGRPVTLCGSCADRDQVARGDPALSGWESEPFRAFTRPELRSWLSARDCEIPVFTRVNGTATFANAGCSCSGYYQHVEILCIIPREPAL